MIINISGSLRSGPIFYLHQWPMAQYTEGAVLKYATDYRADRKVPPNSSMTVRVWGGGIRGL